ncbi:MAG: prefoldin subunit [Nanoarchaeota archaeon]
MEFEEETKKKVEELQLLENYLQNFLMQRQSFNLELGELNNALAELKISDDEVYKISSGVMFKSTKQKIFTELEEKKKVLELKIQSVEKQEKLLEKNSSELREEIGKIISSDTNKTHRK